MHLNQTVRWVDCPPCISVFALTRIRGLSPCGKFALIGWIHHPVAISSLVAAEPAAGVYPPVAVNHWQPSGVDLSTGDRLPPSSPSNKKAPPVRGRS